MNYGKNPPPQPSESERPSLLETMQMQENVYVKELRNLIDLQSDEQIDDVDDDEENLTAEEQKLFDDFWLDYRWNLGQHLRLKSG